MERERERERDIERKIERENRERAEREGDEGTGICLENCLESTVRNLCAMVAISDGNLMPNL